MMHSEADKEGENGWKGFPSIFDSMAGNFKTAILFFCFLRKHKQEGRERWRGSMREIRATKGNKESTGSTTDLQKED